MLPEMLQSNLQVDGNVVCSSAAYFLRGTVNSSGVYVTLL